MDGATLPVWYPASEPGRSRLEPRSREVAVLIYALCGLLALASVGDLRRLEEVGT